MKTFREFITLVEDKMTERLSKMSDDEFEQFLKGRQPKEAKTFRAKRTTVSSSAFRNPQKSAPVSKTSTITKPTPTPPSGGATPPKGGPLTKAEPAGKLSTDVKTTSTKPTAKPTANPLKGLKSGSVLSGAIDTALEKSKGSGWARSVAKGATTALGTLAGGALGSAAGPVGTFAGGTAGGMAASQAFDTVAGANAKERAAMRQQKRQSQSGGALKGIGGKTTFDTKKGTMTTGSGSQKKTVQLGKTSVVTDPKTGKKETGYLAYKGGKAVYKRADTSNAALAKTSSNPLERVGRTLFSGAYKAHDEKMKQQKLKQASASDVKRSKDLGLKKVGPAIVGPKKVGPKVVGPKIVGPAK
jgi:hypothetical protein